MFSNIIPTFCSIYRTATVVYELLFDCIIGTMGVIRVMPKRCCRRNRCTILLLPLLHRGYPGLFNRAMSTTSIARTLATHLGIKYAPSQTGRGGMVRAPWMDGRGCAVHLHRTDEGVRCTSIGRTRVCSAPPSTPPSTDFIYGTVV